MGFTEPVIGPARGPHRARAMGLPHFGPDPLVQPIRRACGDPPTTSQSPRQAAKVEQTGSRHHLEIKHVGVSDLKTDASLRLLDEDIALE
jgi:hypothetical protein